MNIIVLYLGFFPFINFGLPIDSLPIWLILSLLAIKGRLGFNELIIFFILASVSILASLFNSDADSIASNNVFLIVRSIVNLSAVCFAFKLIRYPVSHNLTIHLSLITLIYFIFATIQATGVSDLTSIVPARGGGIRGISSLTSEPSYYGLLSVILIIVKHTLLLSDLRHKKLLVCSIVLDLFALLYFSRSSIAVLLLSWYFILFFRFRIRYLVYISLFVFINVMYITSLESSNRIFVILNMIMNLDFSALLLDQSINQRLSDVLIPMYWLIQDYFLPHGPLGYYEKSMSFRENSSLLFYGGSDVILTPIGELVYVYGFLFIIPLSLLIRPLLGVPVKVLLVAFSLLFISVPLTSYWLYFMFLSLRSRYFINEYSR